MNKVLGRNFNKKHCKDNECEEACKVNKEESLKDFDDAEDFKSALYDAMKKVVKRFAHKGATLKDLENDVEWCILMMQDDEEIPQESKNESLKEGEEEPKEDEKKDDDKGDEDKEESKEPKLETFDEQMDFLAADEQEAIDGYDKVLALVEDEHVKEQLEHIKEEEIAHKEFLEAVKSDKSLVYSHEDKEEEQKDDDIDVEAEVEVVDNIDDDFGFGESLKEDVEEYLSEKVERVLDDYGILYGDIVEYDDKVNIVGVDEDEWYEVVDAIKTELGMDVSVPDEDHEEFDDELIIFKESLKEDTVKKGNKWVNKGKEGTHGEFKTKKEADAQRRAIWVNWNK